MSSFGAGRPLASQIFESRPGCPMHHAPLRLLGHERDPFDARGLEQSDGHLKELYSLTGAEKNVSLFIGLDGRGYHQKNLPSGH